MASMTCRDFHHDLEKWMDGERPANAQSHWKSCVHCGALVRDLSAIQSEAQTWELLPSEPPERIWTSLRAQLESEGLIKNAHLEKPEPRSAGRWKDLFRKFPRPVLAGAYLAALVAFAFAMSGTNGNHVKDVKWLDGSRIVSSPLSAQLDSAELATVASMRQPNSAVSASLHQNLAIVDNYIALCEKSVSEEPDNEAARDFLYDAYQQKADLLTQMSERGETGQ
jgi:hypothetical protein